MTLALWTLAVFAAIVAGSWWWLAWDRRQAEQRVQANLRRQVEDASLHVRVDALRKVGGRG